MAGEASAAEENEMMESMMNDAEALDDLAVIVGAFGCLLAGWITYRATKLFLEWVERRFS